MTAAVFRGVSMEGGCVAENASMMRLLLIKNNYCSGAIRPEDRRRWPLNLLELSTIMVVCGDIPKHFIIHTVDIYFFYIWGYIF